MLVETGLHEAERRKTGGSARLASPGEVALGPDGPRPRLLIDREEPDSAEKGRGKGFADKQVG